LHRCPRFDMMQRRGGFTMPSRKKGKTDLEALEFSLVRQSNELIQQSAYELREVKEQRLLLYLLAQIQPTDTEFQPITLNKSEFCRITGINTTGGQYMREIDDAIARLYDCNLTFRGSRWIPKADGSGEKFMKWITSPEREKGRYILQISPDLAPFLLELRKNFTTLELSWLLQFRGRYAIRAYSYLKSRHYDKAHAYEFLITVDELRAVLGAESYPRWRDFEKRALLPAFMEINQRSDMIAQYFPVYKKNKIDQLKIRIKTKDSTEVFSLLADIETTFGEDQISMWIQENPDKVGTPAPEEWENDEGWKPNLKEIRRQSRKENT
jgi:plasmid replication initiation protein